MKLNMKKKQMRWIGKKENGTGVVKNNRQNTYMKIK